MAAESSQRSTLSSRSRWSYDVFLSFRGETRLGFTDHLHSALQSKGLIVFRDEEKLERGKNIRPSLRKAIQKSEYKVIVISRNYASSTWCLDELIEILKCEKGKVLPVFYDVNPSHVRNQKGSFATAFAQHTKRKVDKNQMTLWRDALRKVCDYSGWDVRGRHESEVVKEICRKIFYGLTRPLLEIKDDLVGIEFQITELMTLLHMREEDQNVCIGDENVRFIGIWGMGGIGKTTLAKVIYNRISYQFDGRCFISDVREKDLLGLQRQLISQILNEEESLICKKIHITSEGQNTIANRFQNKMVLIVLDDVDKEVQLKELVGKTDWFGKRSRVLITSRDSSVLKRHMNENMIYEVKMLSNHDALQLFLLKAFNKPCHERRYVELAKDIVKYAKGLPLALNVFGSSLFDSTIEAWICALDRLKADPGSTILDRLQISYDGLQNCQKKLFLDLACFYKEEYLCDITHRLEALGHFPKFDIPILEKKSLIRISKNGKIEMHNLLQEMGRQLVYLKSLEEPGKRSRLWCHEDIIDVLNNNTGTDAVEAIFLNLPLPKPMELSLKGFSKLKKLRMLMIRPKHWNDYYIGNDETIKDLNTVKWRYSSKFMLSNRLLILEWWRYPLQYLPTNFKPDNLVELKMPMSNIMQLWATRKQNFDKLKYIHLQGSQNLFEMPSFNEFPCLEELNIIGTAIRQLSSSTVPLESLSILRVGGSFSRPVTFSFFDLSFARSLKKLNLVYCNLSDEALSSGLCCLPLLESLNLSGNNFTRINDLSQLPKLRYLTMDYCSELKELPSKFSLSLLQIFVKYCPLVKTSPNPWCIWSSSEVLVGGDSSVVATYFGYNGRRDRTLHFGLSQYISESPSDSSRIIELMPLSWGPTLTSDIPEWFNNRSAGLPDIFGMSRCQIDFGIPEPLKGLWWWIECVYVVLFIVYEVLELDSCQRKGKRETEEIEECENSISRIFPVFDLELQLCNVKFQSVFRVPEFPSIGSNGVWVYMSRDNWWELYNENSVPSCSVTVSSPNVQIRESGGRVVRGYDSECYEIIRRISPNDLASEGIFFIKSLFVHSDGVEEWEEEDLFFNKSLFVHSDWEEDSEEEEEGVEEWEEEEEGEEEWEEVEEGEEEWEEEEEEEEEGGCTTSPF